jgi:hypothetical protein
MSMFTSASKHFCGGARNTCEYTTAWSHCGMNWSSNKGSVLGGSTPVTVTVLGGSQRPLPLLGRRVNHWPSHADADPLLGNVEPR